MMHIDNLMAWQHTSNVSINPNDANSCRRSRFLEISAQRRCIIGPGQFLTADPTAGRKGNIVTVLLKNWSPSMVLMPLQTTGPEEVFQVWMWSL